MWFAIAGRAALKTLWHLHRRKVDDRNERIEALEAALAHITGDRERERAAEQAKVDHYEGKDRPEPGGFAGAVIRVQELKRQARAKAHEEWSRKYEEQTAANASRREKLVQRLAEIGARRQAENDGYAAALAKIAGEEKKVADQIADLDRPPETIEPDLTAARALAAELEPRPYGLPAIPPRPVSVMGF
jgi:DNA repair exonuclease SbcCD ATPase subunit